MSTLRRSLVLLGLVLLAAAGCRSTRAADPSTGYVLTFLVRGPSASERSDAERAEIQKAHLANIGRLADAKKLLIAGPFGEGNPYPEVRGIFVFDTPDEAIASAWTNTDPAVQAGVLAMESCVLRSTSPLRRSYELDQALRAELSAQGREPKPGEMMRGFVMLFARDAKKAEAGLAPLRAAKKICFEGRLQGSTRGGYLAVLDAETPAAALELLGSGREALGRHELVSWWSTKATAQLAGL